MVQITGGKSPRRKGDAFERQVKKALQEEGYHVIRQAGSKFPDLIAVRKINENPTDAFNTDGNVVELSNHVLFIECKMRGYVTRDERKALENLEVYGTPLIASREPDPNHARKTIIVFKNLDKEIVELIGTEEIL